MSGAFVVLTTGRFDRLLKKHAHGHSELADVFAEVISILRSDPYNRSRRHQIKKLEGVPPGEGQYRLRSGRWRFRYDIWSDEQEVELNFCGLRREDTY
jgi:hypothetical protein